ncbi:hypothetical protein [Actinoplanes xinjiangensis]|uniref:hypothetical protein n=1 Tax=Actinoplanes xinjiangensis TaxID=512350 RepID=UPI003433999F
MTKTPRHIVMPTLFAAAAIAFTATELAGSQPAPSTSATATVPAPVIVPIDGPGAPLDPKPPITNDWPW